MVRDSKIIRGKITIPARDGVRFGRDAVVVERVKNASLPEKFAFGREFFGGTSIVF